MRLILNFKYLIFFICILTMFLSSCSIYQSDGRKKFEAEISSSIPQASQLSCVEEKKLSQNLIIGYYNNNQKNYYILSEPNSGQVVIAYRQPDSSDYCLTRPIDRSYFTENSALIFQKIDTWP